MNVKKQAYRKAYTKYMNYMAGDFVQDIIKAIKDTRFAITKLDLGDLNDYN